MPNASTTQSSSASDTTGAAVTLGYGYVWVTGQRNAYYMLQQTGLSGLDYTRAGIWLLGEGEWDGPSELWINDQLAWRGTSFGSPANTWLGWDWQTTLDYPNQDIVFHFHCGCDAVIGSGLSPQSIGPDQGCEKLWSIFPPAIQPLCFSRIAYYALMRKQPILDQSNTNQSDPSQWTDIAPVGLWRGLRCRLFDADGNVTGYAFTINPVWHWVDVTLRRELFPDYNLVYNVGPDPLPAAVSARFNWEKIYASALYCNQQLANGQARFSGSYAFSQQTSLQAIKTKILRCCRAFEQESQGQIAIIVDQPRPSVFTFSRDHILPGSWSATDAPLNTFGNRILGSFRDILVPACNNILSITNVGQADPTVTTDSIPPTGYPQPHPFVVGDWIAIGGTGTTYDGEWEVSSVPAILDPGMPGEVDPSTFTIARRGSNYPLNVGAGGACGLTYSRFKERTPEFWHKNNMLARGAYALSLARQRNKVKDALDFDNCTYDQVSRVSRYERDRNLGFDESPYVAPARMKFKASMFAVDADGNLACGIEVGDVVTLDNTIRWPYAGQYEVVDPLVKFPPQCSVAASGTSLVRSPDPESGELTFSLQTYDEAYMYDDSDTDAAGWPSVPGSYPGNDVSFTSVPLANGGNFVFFTGTLPTGSQFQLPSVGYPAANMLAWASPAGANVQYHSASTVQLCSVDATRTVTLIYSDDAGDFWGGDVNYACLTWLSPDATNTDANGMTWLPLTLLGGEEILFGQGILAHGATIELPAGWSTAQCFATAYVHDMAPNSNIMFLVGAWVDAEMVVHCAAQNHSSATNLWYGNAAVLVFAWKNNMGTVVAETAEATNPISEAVTTENWIKFPLSDGSVFGLVCVKEMPSGSVLVPPESLGEYVPSTLEPMVGPSDSFYTQAGGHAQGVGSCFIDSFEIVTCSFNDGSGLDYNTGSGGLWLSSADVFGAYTLAATAAPAIVRVTPSNPSVAAGGVQQFSATLNGVATQDVTWSVDDVPGGNLVVGTIDAFGYYSAPNVPGVHSIAATTPGGSPVSGSAIATVTGAVLLAAAVLTDPDGTYIQSEGDVVYIVGVDGI